MLSLARFGAEQNYDFCRQFREKKQAKLLIFSNLACLTCDPGEAEIYRCN